MSVHLDLFHHPGMDHHGQLLADRLEEDQHTGYLYTATGTAGTGSDHHQKQKDRLRQLRPHIEIRGGKSGGGDDRSYLEKGVPQCLSQSCIERADIPGDRQSTGENDQKIPTNFFDGKSFLKLPA